MAYVSIESDEVRSVDIFSLSCILIVLMSVLPLSAWKKDLRVSSSNVRHDTII